MSGWQSIQLGDVCDVLDTLRRPITKRDRVAGSIPYYGASGVLDYVAGQLFDEKLVLLGEDGAKWESGANSAFPISGPSWVNNHAHVLRPRRSQLNDNWLIYYLNFADLRPFVTGLTVPKLNQEMMRSIPIPLPPLAEQQRIVDILDEAFEGISVAIRDAAKNVANARSFFNEFLANTMASGDWLQMTFEDCVNRVRYTNKVQRKDFKSAGIYPIVSQEAEFINGFWDDANDLFRVSRPVVVFGDHTRILKFIDFDFVLGADGVKILEPNLKFNAKFFYYAVRAVDLSAIGYARHYRLLKESCLPCPAYDEQSKIAGLLDELEAAVLDVEVIYRKKLTLLTELRQSLLALAFSGELTASTASIANVNEFATPEQAANILAFMYWRHERANRGRFFGHVMGQKTLDLIERVGRVELGRVPYKDAAGPNDRAHMIAAERWAKQQGFFEFVERSGGGYDFKKLSNHSVMLTAAKTALKPIEVQLAQVTDILVGKDTVEAEVFDTVLAAWNNLVAEGAEPSNSAIIYEARENWHPDKLAIPISIFYSAIQEIRRRSLVPDGTSKVVHHRQASLL